jgi:23S rRNA pseudouridine1911/1915/1917 synthase
MSLRTRWRPGDRFLVRHKDDALVVVEKKAGLLTTPTPSGRGADLMALVEEFLGGRRSRPRVFPVHRLDRPVSGLLVIARTAHAQMALRDQFAEHSVERRYVAGVSGVLAEDRGVFESLLTSDPRTLKVRSGEQGRRAVTRWEVIERFVDAQATVVDVELETGRRNQIRVHFAEAGHPLLGEKKYLPDDDPDADLSQGVQRLFLHAAVLGFTHPVHRRRLRFEAPIPPDLLAWQRALAKGRLERPRAAPRRHR